MRAELEKELLDPETFAQATSIIRDGWRGITILSLVGAVVAAIFSFLASPMFQATCVSIPISSNERGGLFGQLAAGLEEIGLQSGSGSSQTQIYPDIVKSRRVLSQVLLSRYPTKDSKEGALLIDFLKPRGNAAERFERGLRQLRNMVFASLDRRTHILSVRVRAKDPLLAAGVANHLTRLMQSYLLESFASHATENRRFVEGRLVEVQGELATAEERLREFREKNIHIANSPRLLTEEARLTRGLREAEEVYLTLRRQFEISKLDEHRDVPLVSVLDEAVPPAFRAFPNRTAITASGLVLGAILGVFIAFRRTGSGDLIGPRARERTRLSVA